MLFAPETTQTAEIHCVGSCDSMTRLGRYEACFAMNGRREYLTLDLQNTTTSRCIIQGLIDSISKLKSPCAIRLVTTTSIGFKKKTGPNHDLVALLKSALAKGQHTFELDIVTGKSGEVLEYIRSAEGNNHPLRQPLKSVIATDFGQASASQDHLSFQTKEKELRWAAYTLPPIDFGWENLSTVEEVLRVFQADEEKARLEALQEDYEFQQEDLPYSSVAFQREWAYAKNMAKEISGGDEELRHDPAVMWIPGEAQFNYAFVFKMQENGTTFVISPVEMPWLKKFSMTDDLMRGRKIGISGSFKQVRWATDLIGQACANLHFLATENPGLASALLELRKLLLGKTNAGWIIANKGRLGVIPRKRDCKGIDPDSIANHPIIGHAVIDRLDEKTRGILQPLLALAQRREFTD